jgi:DNA-binding GntR family transcriptional regulator
MATTQRSPSRVRSTAVKVATARKSATQADADPPHQRLKPHDILAAMKPGVRYSTAMLAEQLGVTVHAINPLLAQLANEGRCWQMPGQRSSVFWIPTSKEARDFLERQSRRVTWNKGSLQGYDEQHRTFRELCMLTRHS